MSRFYASIKGNRGESTRQGSVSSGIEGHVRGWNVGVKVSCYVNSKGQDAVVVQLTSGSRGAKRSTLIGEFTEDDLSWEPYKIKTKKFIKLNSPQ